MFGGFSFDTRTPAERRAEELEEERGEAARKAEAVPWDPNMKFQTSLRIQGSTYNPRSLFRVKPCRADESDTNRCWENGKRKFKLSPTGRWGYTERILRPGGLLQFFTGKRRGMITFDSEVLIPILHRGKTISGGRQYWEREAWMSFTPMEIFSLRPGIRLARGHTVVAGLGMGYQLEQVCAKRNVTRVTLVEESQEIVDWILPKLDLHGTTVDVLVGDAYDIVPTLTADVALIDIFHGWSCNRDSWQSGLRHRWHVAYAAKKELPPRGKIGRTWIWGA